jgi:uncharacterized membrane protein
MSLITCPDCEQRVSQFAPACPHCGRPANVAQPASAERPAYGERPAYAERPAYGDRPAYAAGPAHGAQSAYSAGPAYGAPAAYAPAPVDPLAAKKQNVQIAYGLYAGSYMFAPLLIVAVIMCYVQRGSIRHTWLDAHYDWLIDTFWMSLLGSLVLGVAAVMMMLVFAPFGFLTLVLVVLAAMGWPIYRLVVGYTALTNGRTPVGTLSSPRW